MDALILENRKYSLQEYLNLLERSPNKLEFIDGHIRMMAGASRAHNDIADNTFVALRNGKTGCYIKSSDTAVANLETGTHFFPDISATCTEPTFAEGGIARLTNPALLIEVLSRSTSRYDKSVKFNTYKTLPSFKEYITIDSLEYFVYTFYKEDNGLWRIGNYSKLDQEVEIITLGMKVPMSVIYAGVDLADESLPEL